jgi:hypothetical protein
MGMKNFDDFIGGLQTSVVTARDSVKARYEEAVRRIYETDKTGAAKTSVITFAVPGKGGNEDEYEMFPLSILSFHENRSPRISMLSLEFECELKKKKFSGSSWTHFLIIKKKKKRPDQKCSHRIQIMFNGVENPSGEVRLDGELFMDIPGRIIRYSGPAQDQEKVSLFRGIINRLRWLRQPQGFIMTEEQARRIAEIMKKTDSATGEKTDESGKIFKNE